MRRILFILTLLAVGLTAVAQTGTGWYKEQRKMNNRDSVYFAKDANFIEPIRIDGISVTSQAAELNILDGALCTFTELNYLVGVSSNIQTQLNTKQATLVSGTNIKTVNSVSLLGSGNIVIEGGEGGSMTYPGAGIALSTGLAWGTSITNNSVQWDSAYVRAYRWSGSPIGLTAATGRTSLGATAAGSSFFTLTNPGAITFPRINADNTVTALSAANFKTALSLTATDVSLGNVTNESKTTMFTNPAFTGTATVQTAITSSVAGIANLGSTTVPWSNLYLKDNGSIYFDTDDVYLYHPTVAPNELWMVGGDYRIQAGSLLMNSGSIGATGQRVVKGWFTDLEVTNTITGTASAVTGFTRNSGALTLSGGHGLTFTTTGITGVTLPTSGTLATQSYAIGAINDSITGRIAAATVGVALADSNVYVEGYATPTFVDSKLGSGGGLSAERLPFIIGHTTGAPTTADSTITHTGFAGKHIDLYRDGAKQYQNFTATNTVEGYRVNGNTITVYPLWQDNEQILVDIIEPILWSYLSLEGEESSLLDSLRGYWKLDEASGTTVIDAAGIQDGQRTSGVTAGVAGILGDANGLATAADVIYMPYNNNTVPKGVDFSVAVWFKFDVLPTVSGRDNYLFQQNIGAAPWSAHYMYVDKDDNKLRVTSKNTGGTAYEVESSGALSVATWYYAVFVNAGNGTTLKLYLNGADVSAVAGTFTGTLYKGLYETCFGNAYDGSSSQLDGVIDDVAIWGRVLSAGEVTTLYNSGNGKVYPFN